MKINTILPWVATKLGWSRGYPHTLKPGLQYIVNVDLTHISEYWHDTYPLKQFTERQIQVYLVNK